MIPEDLLDESYANRAVIVCVYDAIHTELFLFSDFLMICLPLLDDKQIMRMEQLPTLSLAVVALDRFMTSKRGADRSMTGISLSLFPRFALCPLQCYRIVNQALHFGLYGLFLTNDVME